MPYLTSSSLPIFLSHIFILSSHLSSHLQSSPWSQFILQQRNTEFEGKRDWRRRRVDSWLAGTFAVYIRSKDTWWRQGTLVQSNLRMAKSAKSKSACVHFEHVHVYISTSAFPIVCMCTKQVCYSFYIHDPVLYQHFYYLAWELSSGAVTKCLLLSLLKTKALPLARTPQPKLTSAPRSEEKLW